MTKAKALSVIIPFPSLSTHAVRCATPTPVVVIVISASSPLGPVKTVPLAGVPKSVSKFTSISGIPSG